MGGMDGGGEGHEGDRDGVGAEMGGTREGEKQCCESPETTGRGTRRHTGHWGAGDSTGGALGAPHLPPAPPAQVMIVPGLSSRGGKHRVGSGIGGAQPGGPTPPSSRMEPVEELQ